MELTEKKWGLFISIGYLIVPIILVFVPLYYFNETNSSMLLNLPFTNEGGLIIQVLFMWVFIGLLEVLGVLRISSCLMRKTGEKLEKDSFFLHIAYTLLLAAFSISSFSHGSRFVFLISLVFSALSLVLLFLEIKKFSTEG